MRINQLILRNVGGVRELDIRPGHITVIEGRNGEGKSSTIKGLRSLFTKGKFGTLLSEGAESGEIVAIMDDDTVIRRELRANGDSPLTVTKSGHKLSSPATFVESIVDPIVLNAATLMYAKDSERLQILFEAVACDIDREALQKIVPSAPVPEGHPLEVLSKVHKYLYDERTAEGRTLKDKRANAEQLEQSIPVTRPESEILPKINGLELEEEALRKEWADQKAEAAKRKEAALNDASEDRSKRLKEANTRYQQEVDRLKQERDEHERELNREYEAVKDGVNASHSDAEASFEAEYSPKLADIRLELTTLRTDRDLLSKSSTIRELAKKAANEADAAEQKVKAYTEQLEALEGFKRALLRNIPIPGVEIKDGEIYLDGEPWSHVPDSRKAIFGVDIACVRAEAKNLDVIAIDAMECLDPDHFALWEMEIARRGKQVFCARTTAGEYNVRVVNAEELVGEADPSGVG